MWRLPHALAAIALVAMVSVAAAGAESAPTSPRNGLFGFSFLGTPTMIVDPARGSGADEVLVASGAEGDGESSSKFAPPAKVTVGVPAGYPLPATPVGGRLGDAVVIAADGSSLADLDASLYLYGPVTAADPVLYPPDSTQSACDPRPHNAVWVVTLGALGTTFDIPVFVDAPSNQAEAAELVFCAPVPRTSDGKPTRKAPLALGIIAFTSFLPAPGKSTRYLWSANVTPLDADLTTPSPSRAFELRAELPSKLTLTGPKSAKSYQVVLHGRLTVGGRPLAGAEVDVVNDNGEDLAFVDSEATTDRNGRFSVKMLVDQPTTFVATAYGPVVARCSGSSTAPAGCTSTTIPAPPPARWKVRVAG